MASDYDIEIIEILENRLKDKSVSIVSPNISFEMIEKNYPISYNRINWSLIPTADHTTINESNLKEEVADFINKIINKYPGLENEKVVIIGDDLFENGYELPFLLFKELFSTFFEIPQHTYVIFQKSKKCLNYTFEGDIYFGSPYGSNTEKLDFG